MSVELESQIITAATILKGSKAKKSLPITSEDLNRAIRDLIALKNEIDNGSGSSDIGVDVALASQLIVDLPADVDSSATTLANLNFVALASLESISLPELATLTGLAEGSLIQNNVLLESFYAPQLVSAANYIDIVSNATLTDIDLSSLESITSSSWGLRVGSNNILTSLNLPNYQYGGLQLTNNPLLDTLNISNLITGPLQITDQYLLTGLNIPNYTDGSISISGNAVMTGPLDLSGITAFTGTGIGFNSNAFTSIDLSNITTAPTTAISFYAEQYLTDISIGNLESCRTFFLQQCMIEELDLSSLITVNAAFSPTGFNINNNTLLESIDLSSLSAIADGTPFKIIENPVLTSVDISSLNSFGNYSQDNLGFWGNTSLVNLTIPATFTVDSNEGRAFIFTDNALSQASVDQILLAFDNAIAGPPSSGYHKLRLNNNASTDGSPYIGTNASPTGGATNVNYLSLVAKGLDIVIEP